MNSINSSKFWQGIKKARKVRYICIAIFAIASVLFGIIGYIESKRVIEFSVDLSKSREVVANEYAYLDVIDGPYLFAERDEYSSKLYFVWDVNEQLHIVDLLSDLVQKLEKATVDNPVRITGETKEITGEIKDVAIFGYNRSKTNDSDLLLRSEFENQAGKVYLYAREDLTNAGVFYGGALIFLGFALALLIAHLVIESKIRSRINKLSPEEAELISNEIEKEGTIIYEKVNIFLTEHYIISLGKSLDITKYSDIVWVYHTDLRQNGVLSNRYVNIITNEHEDRSIPIIPYGKTKNVHLEIIDIIASKNSSILVGYTDENVAAMKDAKKEFKRNKDSLLGGEE